MTRCQHEDFPACTYSCIPLLYWHFMKIFHFTKVNTNVIGEVFMYLHDENVRIYLCEMKWSNF